MAAGGGSRLFFRCGRYDVGPESARAHPGPVCYRKSKHSFKNELLCNKSLGKKWLGFDVEEFKFRSKKV